MFSPIVRKLLYFWESNAVACVGVVCLYVVSIGESSQSVPLLLATGERKIAIGCESVSQSVIVF